MGDYYRIDVRRLSLRECWNITRSPACLILLIGKAFNFQILKIGGFYRPDTLADLAITERDVPDFARPRLLSAMTELAAHGFTQPFFFTVSKRIAPADIYSCALLHPSGECFVVVTYERARNVTPHQIKHWVTFVSLKTDGGQTASTNKKREMDDGPQCTCHYLEGASIEKTWLAHRHVMEQPGSLGLIRRLHGSAEMQATVLANEHEEFDRFIDRRFLQPMTPEEVADARLAHETWLRTQAPVAPPTPPSSANSAPGPAPVTAVPVVPPSLPAQPTSLGVDPENEPIIAEIAKLRNKKSGAGGAILLLVVTAVIFLGAGSAEWTWEYAAMLLPILFLHELGHFAAMKAFKYRDLKIFFLPLLGAAASGVHYNVAGWKKAIVSLMGPLPGIALAIILGGFAIASEHALLLDAAFLTLIINGINLVPLHPLDGGWVMHAILFSRHPVLSTGFRLLAGITFIGLFIGLNDRFLMFLGIFTLIGVPAAHKQAKIAAKIRDAGIPGVSEDSMTIPPPTANAIINELKKEYPTGLTNNLSASTTLQIFETLNAKPPNLWASLGLLGAYAGGLVAVLVFGMVFAVARHGDLGDFFDRAVAAPQTPVSSADIRQWPGELPLHLMSTAPLTLSATFESRSAAEAAWSSTTNQVGTNGAVSLFGRSLLVLMPSASNAERSRLYDDLATQQAKVTVDKAAYNPEFTLLGDAGQPASNSPAAVELEAYFQIRQITNLIPPWLPDDPRTATQREAHQRARATYARLQETEYDLPDEFAGDLYRHLRDANRKGNLEAARSLQKQIDKLRQQAISNSVQTLIATESNRLDLAIIPLYRAAADLRLRSRTNDVLAEEFARVTTKLAGLLGQGPATNAPGSIPHHWYGGAGGYSEATGPKLQISINNPRKLFFLAPTLVRWLETNGFENLKYRIGDPYDAVFDEDEEAW